MEKNTVEAIIADLCILDHNVEDIEKKYGTSLPQDLKILLHKYEGQFVRVSSGEHYRILDRDEILDPERHFGLDCIAKGLVPFIDCKDNNFLMYNYLTKMYEMLNIVDEVHFDNYASLIEFWSNVH